MGSTDKTKTQLEQLFLYLNLKCNAQCITCYMHKHYSTIREISFEMATQILKMYQSWGARKLTLLGGEPTLYPHLEELLKFAKDTGWQYVRIQTNGQFDSEILEKPLIQKNVDTFSFSIDGHTEASTRRIRIGCSLNKTLENMIRAKRLGYDVRVNITITSINIDHIFDIINLAEDNGASMVYLNIVFPMGAASNQPYLSVSPEQWINIFNKIKKNFSKLKAKVKIPIGYTAHVPVDHCCIALKISKLYVMPCGDAYPCILFVDNPRLRLNVNSYWDKLTTYAKALPQEMNSWCHFLPLHASGLKPTCIYYRKVFGGQ